MYCMDDSTLHHLASTFSRLLKLHRVEGVRFARSWPWSVHQVYLVCKKDKSTKWQVRKKLILERKTPSNNFLVDKWLMKLLDCLKTVNSSKKLDGHGELATLLQTDTIDTTNGDWKKLVTSQCLRDLVFAVVLKWMLDVSSNGISIGLVDAAEIEAHVYLDLQIETLLEAGTTLESLEIALDLEGVEQTCA